MDSSSESIRLLHVDDNKELLDLAVIFLERLNEQLSVETAGDVNEGLERLAGEPFDCIVSDYDMPGQNGIDFLKAVRESHPDIPFILFTGKGSEEIASDAISAGVSDYLQKASGSDQYSVLANRITNLVAQYRAETNLQRRVTQQSYVAELGQLAIEGVPLQKLFETTVDRVATALTNEYAKVLDYEPEENYLELVAGVGWKNGLVGSATVGDELDSQAGYTLHTDEPVIVDDLRTEERFSGPQLLIDHNVVSGISVIIGSSSNPWGVLGTHTTDQRRFTTDDVNFVQSVANVLASAIQQKMHQEQLERYRAAFENAFDAMVLSDDTGQYVEVNQSACELFGVDREALLGRRIAEFAPEDSDFEVAWDAFQANEFGRDTVQLVRADGEQRTVEYAATANIVPGVHLTILREATDRVPSADISSERTD